MFIPLSLLLASSLLVSSGDTVKKKAPEKASAPKPAGIVQAGVPVSRVPSAPASLLIGKAIQKSMANTVRSVVPRASYLSAAISHRASRGPSLPPGIAPNPNIVPFTADSIVVEKSRHTMTLYNQGAPVRIYFIALGQNPLGDKTGIGDNRTPEGLYYIAGHNPASKYHLSLKVSYPNDQDLAEARSRGVAPGGDIMIHGLPRGFENVGAEHRQRDWTNGCIAVTNAEIEEIWSAIPDGAAIHIKP